MTTMNISLPEPMKAFIEEQAAKEGFNTVSEYLRAIIGNLQKRQKTKQELDACLLEGEQSPVIPMTDKRWAELEQKVRRRSPQLDEG
jgi:antitoxin ParD1/3/4